MNIFHLANGSTMYRIEYPVSDLAWVAPQQHKNIYFFGVSGGGGGGSGCGGPENTQRGGGAGGCKGHWASVLLPNKFSQPFYLTVGAGGAGAVGSGTTGTSGSAGTGTVVFYKTPNRGFGTPGQILSCGIATSGAGGTTTGGGAGNTFGTGQAGSAWWTMWYASTGSPQTSIGSGGGATGVGTQSVTDVPTSGGAGGAGCPSGSYTAANGGQTFGYGPLYTLLGGFGNVTQGGAGDNGRIAYWGGPDSSMIISQGGSGGGNSNTGPGGSGGNGAPGCGGGGGGGGFTGGNGGAGGNGILIILTW